MKISLIYARSINHCIGKAGSLPWHLPDESRFFHETTLGKPVIMGRGTYEDHASLLPGRTNLVVSRTPDLPVAEGIQVTGSLDLAIETAARESSEVFIIGGVRLFSLALPLASSVYESIIDAVIDGDVYLPEFDFSDWQTTLLQRHDTDDSHRYAFEIYRHHRAS